MHNTQVATYIKNVLQNFPSDWLHLTTHRLDIYDESQAKSEFLEKFETLFKANNFETEALHSLPTAYDYIRLGHPLSTLLEWKIAKSFGLSAEAVISFSSQTMPVLAVLRKNLLSGKKTQLLYTESLPKGFDEEVIKNVYGYTFEVSRITSTDDIPAFDGSTIVVSTQTDYDNFALSEKVDFYVHLHDTLGSILIVNGQANFEYISDIQHVRRRESIAMNPVNALKALKRIVKKPEENVTHPEAENKSSVQSLLSKITNTTTTPLVASSGLSMQYAIMMGLVDHAQQHHDGKAIKFIVPPNCYGGTNDQARRVAAVHQNVDVVDLPVDGDNDMVQSLHTVLSKIAHEDAIPYIIAEIPTNPRVEVPDLDALKDALAKKRQTASGEDATPPLFILDQTFCPNVHFLGEGDILSSVQAISYASGSKFPSGGKVTAGYVVSNDIAAHLMPAIEKHLLLCDNEATTEQYHFLAQQLPSMNKRIAEAYENTRKYVDFIAEVLPEAKINFVSEELAQRGFTPSVFSLKLPAKGNSPAEIEQNRRALNLKLINMMITQIPQESKYCVSYGQLKGVYWTIPATSTQGTTKEGDKDYIVRASLSANMDLEKHKKVFLDFVKSM
ncbi:PLP-dependent transferase [Dokdonia sp. Hel_I_53]|uniref:PLP-dependent transferase n=1 Tax=Dokdonia sp. Hel_I_53 TaxID=1566287 RepID=UPI00119B6289|nr:PLP-dependent transferase [Dokdonia sp. Hel_I_53]TVZ53053.1 Cys/Met metabolism PLP-dependent enzyme [Dokdonia sp. Hel_I_53]